MSARDAGMSDSAAAKSSASLPLSALLSQTLVAFTIELDNEFEKRMAESGYPGAILSQIVWLTVVRFLTRAPVSVRDLARKALTSPDRMYSMLGCLERWRFVTLKPAPGGDQTMPMRMHRLAGRILRDGWGSARGIRPDWRVSLTGKGQAASETWEPLGEEIERRWERRLGGACFRDLRQTLENVVNQLDSELPWALIVERSKAVAGAFPPRAPGSRVRLPLPVLLSQLLLTFAIEFDAQAEANLGLSANILRVLSEEPVAEAEIPRRTGASPETSGLGWETKPYVVSARDPAAKRGKTVRLTPRGVKAQRDYFKLVKEIERDWEVRFGKDIVGELRSTLQKLFEKGEEDRARIALGLIPPPGVVRAGREAPGLGRLQVAAAARKRAREMARQNEAFVSDPAGALPHFPLWDINRGFGP